MKHIVLIALLALFFAPAAKAKTMDPRVAVLKGQIDGFLDNQKAMALRNNCNLKTTGETTVEKANGYYAFTLPNITYTDAKGVRSEIGMLAINATPEDKGNWKITLALPTPINSFDKTGKEIVRTDIGSQNASGIWNENLGHFTSVSGTFGNIRISDLVEQGTVTIGGLTVSSLLNELDPQAWTGTAKAELSNISVFDAESNFTGVIPKVAMTTNIADRASTSPMTREQIKSRTQAGYPDGYNAFALLMGAPERVQATVTGLDSVSTKLQQAMLTAKPETRAEFLSAILGVSAISGIGKPIPGDASSKAYDVVFGKNGQVTVNGTDFGSLTQIRK